MADDPKCPPPEGGKSCSKCARHYDDVAENFYRRSGGKYWASACKTCCRACKKEAYWDDPEKHREAARGSYRSHREKRLAAMREWRRTPAGREWVAKYNSRYYEENREEILEQQKEYREENQELIAERNRRYREENPEYFREYERNLRPPRSEEQIERFREYQSQWAKENRDKKNAAKHRRRAKKEDADGDHGPEDIQRQKVRQSGRCYWCGCKLSDDYHLDHRVPLSRGGSNGPENLVIACVSCNLSKHAKTPGEFLGMLELWS